MGGLRTAQFALGVRPNSGSEIAGPTLPMPEPFLASQSRPSDCTPIKPTG